MAMTQSSKSHKETRNFFRRAEEAELQSWLDHKVSHVANKKVADKDRVMRARRVLSWKYTSKAMARLCVLGFQDPNLTEVHRDSSTLSARSEAVILKCVATNKRKLV